MSKTENLTPYPVRLTSMTAKVAIALSVFLVLGTSCTAPEPESTARPEGEGTLETRGVAFDPSPPTVVRSCRSLQDAADYTVLCPERLPRNFRSVANCQPPTAPKADALVERGRAYGIDISHGSLHFAILGVGGPNKMGPQDHWDFVGARELAGHQGRLYYVPHDEMAFHAGHLVFYFHAHDHLYAASLHAHDQSRWDDLDVSQLERLLSSLRPANRLPGEKSIGGDVATRVVGEPLQIFEPGDGVVGGRTLWTTSYAASKVFRIANGAVSVTAEVPSNPYRGMLLLDGKLWISASGAGRVVALDGRTGEMLHSVATGSGPEDLTVLDGTLWVLNVQDATISGVDPVSAETIGSPIRLDGNPVALDSSKRHLWVVDCSIGSLLKVDPASRQTVASVEVGPGANDVETLEGSIWISDWSKGQVLRVAPATAQVVAEIPAGDTPGRLAGRSGSLWVADPRGRAITRIDSNTNEVIETLRLGDSPFDVVVGKQVVWVLDVGRVYGVRFARASR